MKHSISILFIAVCLSFSQGCTEVSQFQEDIADLQRRVTALEELCRDMNNNISAIQTIATAAQNNNYITAVTPLMKSGVEIGYTITFASGDPITIYHGNNGLDGTNGTDGHSPKIGVKMDVEGVYYWTIDDEWLLDSTGQKVKAVGVDGTNGTDGINGTDGTNGNDGITPQLKIEDDYWYISMDNGVTWTKLSRAKGEDGKNGQDGTGGDSMFTHIDYTTSEDYVVFTLSNGVSIQVPTWSAFDRLNQLCNQMNSNLEGMTEILGAIEGAKYIKSFVPITENDKEIGYILTLSDNTTIKLYHGKDGADGNDGTPGHSPAIAVKKDTDGIWYWTKDGEWLLDTNGLKVRAVGTDGANGTNGTNGNDGITPQLKVEDGYWYVSVDKGDSWTKIGKATGDKGEDGDSFFKSVTEDDNYVYFSLTNDAVFTLPKSSVLEVIFDPAENITLKTGVKETITYNVTSSLAPVKVEVITSSDIRATVQPSTNDGKQGIIDVVSRGEIDEYSRIAVIISNGEKVIMRTFTPIDGGSLILAGAAFIRMPASGGIADIAFMTNLDYEILIPDDVKDWISLLPSTKGLSTTVRQLQIKENFFDERSATLIVRDSKHTITIEYTIVQNSVALSAIDMGLSVRWSTFNIGAKTVTDAGYYYAWGDPDIKDDYDYYTYKWCYSGTNNMSKYNSSDGKTVLEREDDVANIVLGDKWRTPTYDEWEELQSECIWTWTSMKGVNGYIVTSKINNNKIFLPAGGNYGGATLYNYNSEGIYWSSSLVEGFWNLAWYMAFKKTNANLTHNYPRWEGRTIRPVIE